MSNYKSLVILFAFVFTAVTCQFMAGGRKPVDLNNQKAQEETVKYAKFAINEITNKRRKEYGNSALNFNLIRVLEAHTQIVSGINRFIKLRMKDAYCRMNCAVEICSLTIYEQPWTNTTVLKDDYECKSERTRKVYALGRVQNISSNKDEVVNAVNYAIADANIRSNKENYFKLIEITSAQHQIVSGSNYFLEFKVGETNCKKSDGIAESKNCAHLNASNKITCNVNILDQPWMSSRYKITRSECEF